MGGVGEIGVVVGRECLSTLVIVSDLMLTSKGRDKVFSLLQYSSDLYLKSMTYSPDFGHLAA